MQSDEDVKPDTEDQVPAKQLVQELAPETDENVPGKQSRQTEILLARDKDENFPKTQSWHILAL